MSQFDNLLKKHIWDWVPEVFPAGLPDLMLGSWGLEGSLLPSRSSLGWPQLGDQKSQKPWLLCMSWSLDLTPQRRFKIFLNSVFQFWNFCGIPLFQELQKTCFPVLPDHRLQHFLPPLLPKTNNFWPSVMTFSPFTFWFEESICHLFNLFPPQGLQTALGCLCSLERFLCLFREAIHSKTLTAFTGGRDQYFPCKEPRKSKMIATCVFARQHPLPRGCAGSALVRNNAQYLAVLQNLASSLLVCLWQVTATLWRAD